MKSISTLVHLLNTPTILEMLPFGGSRSCDVLFEFGFKTSIGMIANQRTAAQTIRRQLSWEKEISQVLVKFHIYLACWALQQFLIKRNEMALQFRTYSARAFQEISATLALGLNHETCNFRCSQSLHFRLVRANHRLARKNCFSAVRFMPASLPLSSNSSWLRIFLLFPAPCSACVFLMYSSGFVRLTVSYRNDLNID